MSVQGAALSKSAQERLQRTRILERYALARTGFRVVGVIGIAALARAAIGDLAGQETSLTVSTALSVVGNLKIAFSITLAGSAAAWALIERTLRRRKTETLQNRIISLEKELDPRRSSSSLTSTGKTNPRDRRK
jgi:hypothetical protein